MLPTRTISETMVASCTASGSNVSDACSDLCFIWCKSKPEAATTSANIFRFCISLSLLRRAVVCSLCSLCGLMCFKRERARVVSLSLSLLRVCVCVSLQSHTRSRSRLVPYAVLLMCACACVCVFIMMFSQSARVKKTFPETSQRRDFSNCNQRPFI